MLLLTTEARSALWRRLTAIVEDYAQRVHTVRVTPLLDPEKIRAELQALDFARGWEPVEALDFAAEHLWQYQTHTPHPRYFGLYNPAPTAMGIAGDALVAAFNPQIAAWSHSPFAAEVEDHLVRAFGMKLGYAENAIDGVFCSGGAEANHTAVLAALTSAFPEYGSRGARALAAQPVLYASAECHHSFLKAACLSGIGAEAVRSVPVDDFLRLDIEALRSMLAADRRQGLAPFLIVGTAGTTNAGAIDPLPAIADVAADEGIWYHADAAWGGAAALSPGISHLLAGIERADSITFDAHKWLSAPMGAGVLITRHKEILTRTFSTPTAYMPKDAKGLDVTDPHLHSMQWSRRFIGLKVFLSLLVAGWDGYAATIEHMTAMGNMLRGALELEGWQVVNSTALPVVCFVDLKVDTEKLARAVVESGEAWISSTVIAGHVVIRACITNYRTTERDVRALVDTLARRRQELLRAGGY